MWVSIADDSSSSPAAWARCRSHGAVVGGALLSEQHPHERHQVGEGGLRRALRRDHRHRNVLPPPLTQRAACGTRQPLVKVPTPRAQGFVKKLGDVLLKMCTLPTVGNSECVRVNSCSDRPFSGYIIPRECMCCPNLEYQITFACLVWHAIPQFALIPQSPRVILV